MALYSASGYLSSCLYSSDDPDGKEVKRQGSTIMTIRRFRLHRYDGLLVGLVLILLLSGFLQNTAKPLNPLSIPLTFYLIVYPLMLLGLWRIIGRSLIRPELLVRFPKRRAFILFYLRNTRLQRWVYSGLVTLSCLLSLTSRSLDEGISRVGD